MALKHKKQQLMTENTTNGQPEAMTGRERQLAALAKHGKSTQFKPGHPGNPDAGRTASVRSQIRYLMTSADLKRGDDGKWTLDLPAGAKPTTIYAASVMLDGLNAKTPSVRLKFAQWLTEQIDGKLIQANLNADLAAMQAMSEEELYAFIAQLDDRIGPNPEGDGAVGDSAEAGTPSE